MSQLKASKLQAGISVTPANNFVLDASADDGTVVLKRADGTEILSVDTSGNLIGKSTDVEDVTAKRLLQVGDFGLGGYSVPVAGIADLNDVIANGFYKTTIDTLNKPSGEGSGGSVLVIGWGASVINQIYFGWTSTDPIFVRQGTYGGTWSAWGLLYDSRNILGTVSQSGGVPTGRIIERGSNANGDYIKFADGTMICMDARSYDAAMSALGNIYGNIAEGWSYPAAFSDTPTISANDTASSNIWINCSGGLTTASFRAFFYTTLTGTRNVSLFAIGRWF